jgi:hypothetical protein
MGLQYAHQTVKTAPVNPLLDKAWQENYENGYVKGYPNCKDSLLIMHPILSNSLKACRFILRISLSLTGFDPQFAAVLPAIRF